ncbi:MAG: hypothetical protein ACK5GZ_09945 [Cyanobium sp.]|jgi:hypothetical protein
MAKLLFVHGTGVRQPCYDETLRLITAKIGAAAEVLPCYWGDLGSRLGAAGQSIPAYDTTRSGLAPEAEALDAQEFPLALWQALLSDPFYELRSLALKPQATIPAFQQTQGEQLIETARQMELSDALQALLGAGEVPIASFETARRELLVAPALRKALQAANEGMDEYRTALARAWIATAAKRLHDDRLQSTGEWCWPALVLDAELRSEVEQQLVDALGGQERGLTGWVMHNLSWPLRSGLSHWGTNWGSKRRGALSDAASPAAGDIMLYQARGEAIRARIRERILAAGEPVHLLAHSLGGVACVDLLASEALPVRQLITVGSQAPFLYEINALLSLPFGQPLPASVPPWLNLYDPRDFLSYIGASIFQGRVVDQRVDNCQAFPSSHSAYWWNGKVWEAIHSTLPR